MTTNEILLIVFGLVICALVVVLVLTKRNHGTVNGNFDDKFKIQTDLFKSLSEQQAQNFKLNNDSVINVLSNNFSSQNQKLLEVQAKLEGILQTTSQELEKTKLSLENGLSKLQEGNEKKLEQMRATVDEKLNVTLETRLTQSFSLINKNLEAVYKGLGEMQTLAVGVGDLKKVLTNVKTRGVWGEVSLNALLEQILTTEQFEKNIAVKPKSQERVDFAIKLPGKDESVVLLPIDSKFPIEDYQRLVEASEQGNLPEVEMASKMLERRVKDEAKSISEKYICLPHTTDFAILYLATEGLYGEIAKRTGLVETLQRTLKVMIAGPSTISALLSSLQMGFKTLAIEKRSSEIWSLLGTIKQEFDVFTSLLVKTQKKLSEASTSIELATKKTQTIAKKLRNVTSVESEKPTDLLEEIIGQDSPDVDPEDN